jgi:hypothetical protein
LSALCEKCFFAGALHIEGPQLLVVCVFMLTLGAVLRFSGIRLHPNADPLYH